MPRRALLRKPDSASADALIVCKFESGLWDQYFGNYEPLFVYASTWSLLLTGRMVNLGKSNPSSIPTNLIEELVKGASKPVLRQPLRHAMHMMGDQFVRGRTI